MEKQVNLGGPPWPVEFPKDDFVDSSVQNVRKFVHDCEVEPTRPGRRGVRFEKQDLMALVKKPLLMKKPPELMQKPH